MKQIKSCRIYYLHNVYICTACLPTFEFNTKQTHETFLPPLFYIIFYFLHNIRLKGSLKKFYSFYIIIIIQSSYPRIFKHHSNVCIHLSKLKYFFGIRVRMQHTHTYTYIYSMTQYCHVAA